MNVLLFYLNRSAPSSFIRNKIISFKTLQAKNKILKPMNFWMKLNYVAMITMWLIVVVNINFIKLMQIMILLTTYSKAFEIVNLILKLFFFINTILGRLPTIILNTLGDSHCIIKCMHLLVVIIIYNFIRNELEI